jgi:hypothetical protein
LFPAVGKLIAQLPARTVPVQVSPTPSLTVTLPIGLPRPGATGETLNLTVTGCLTTEGLGVLAVIAVVLLPFARIPVPDSVMLCGLPAALSVMVTEPARAPIAVVSEPMPLLVSVTLWEELVVPTGSLPKVMLLAERVTPGAAAAEILATNALSVPVKLAPE